MRVERIRGDGAADAWLVRAGLVAVIEVAAGNALDER